MNVVLPIPHSSKVKGNCAIYVRVSKEDQSYKNQIESCKTFALSQNYRVYNVYKEKISGIKDSRPELNNLMMDARNKLFNVVIIWKLDRLGRSLKHLLKIVEEWQKQGIDFICVSQSIDTTSASGKLVFHILGAISEFERELISERTKLGLKNAKNVGKRGKDKKQRRKSGYLLRYQKKGRGVFNEF